MPVTIEVQRFRVRSLDVDFHEISWELGSTTEDVFDYTFKLLRSESSEGPYEAITPEMDDRYLFVDNNIRRKNLFRQHHYKLQVRHKPTGDTRDFGPVSKAPESDLIGTELRKHMNILMREFIGRRCWVLPVRTFGMRCGACYNTTLGKRRCSGCLSCFDTGFVKGYMTPVEAWISIDPTPAAEQDSNTGPTHQQNTTARMGYYPMLKPRDVIVEGENKRWRVVSISTTEQVRSPVHQEMQLHEIPSGDTEYRVDFDIEHALKDLWLTPARNYTNPHNLDAFEDEEIPDIMSLYPGGTYSDQP
jgi:hypothetical protein